MATLTKPIETDSELLVLLEKAVTHEMTPAEIFWQRVSFIMAEMPDGTDCDEIAKKIAHYAGFEVPPPNPYAKGSRS